VLGVSSAKAPSVHEVAASHQVDTTQLVASAAQSEHCITELRAALQDRFPLDAYPGIDIVVVGSVGKRWSTRGSDIDFFGMTEQPLEPGKTEPLIRTMVEKAVALGLDTPFAQGTNATFVQRSAIETVDIGGDDTRSVFRRLQFVTGSVSVYRPELRARIHRNVLSTFVGRERTPRIRGVVDQILTLMRIGNSVAEWRMKDRLADGGLIQWTKCFTLYRIDQAASLAAVIRAGTLCEGRSREELIETLSAELDRPPLERLLTWYPELTPSGQQAVGALIAAANDTLRLYDTDGVRPRLAALVDDEPTRELRATFEHQARSINKALVQLFFHEPVLRPWTEEIGLFG
jgi:hypothetical protein